MEEKIRFYFDEHMPCAVEQGVVERGYEVIMAVEVDMTGKDDDTEHLPFAAEKGAVVVTRALAFAGRAVKRTDHAGVIRWTGAQNDFGGMIRALTEFAGSHTPEEVAGNVFWVK